ncbi:hypothetical protein BDR04DRAFT_1092158 [Suillus decipiens]|nr:hypothetical protein BDR04DRAFT_1092158 [Suillus decipiens]
MISDGWGSTKSMAGNTTMLNAGRMKHVSKVNRQCRSATQPWRKSQSSILRGLWHQRQSSNNV